MWQNTITSGYEPDIIFANFTCMIGPAISTLNIIVSMHLPLRPSFYTSQNTLSSELLVGYILHPNSMPFLYPPLNCAHQNHDTLPTFCHHSTTPCQVPPDVQKLFVNIPRCNDCSLPRYPPTKTYFGFYILQYANQGAQPFARHLFQPLLNFKFWFFPSSPIPFDTLPRRSPIFIC